MNVYPAMKAKMGRWEYFVVKMTMRELSDSVKFASDIYEDRTLDRAIQRVLNEGRARKEIATYLIQQSDRFFSSIVVAALSGSPKWYPVTMEEDERFTLLRSDNRLNNTFGVLSFDGRENYYALDGQHRLAAIKALVDPKSDLHGDAPPGFRDEEISVIIVVPTNQESAEEFFTRYRRLFGNLNRYAKPMDNVTNIIMDEDDAFAIITRRLITDHEFFKWSGNQKNSDRVKTTKGKNLRSTDTYFTSLETLYAMNIKLLSKPQRLSYGWDSVNSDARQFVRFRPEEDFLDSLFDELRMYWDGLIDTLPELKKDPQRMRNHALSENSILDDSALFWPIGQELLAALCRELLNFMDESKTLSIETIKSCLSPLKHVNWEMHAPPWVNVVLIPDNKDETAWKIRNEERSNAVLVVKRIISWQIGLDRLALDEELSLREEWESMLLPAMKDSRKEELWQQILGSVIR